VLFIHSKTSKGAAVALLLATALRMPAGLAAAPSLTKQPTSSDPATTNSTPASHLPTSRPAVPARLDHSINRYANRSQSAPAGSLFHLMTGGNGLEYGDLDDSKLECLMMVHSDDKPEDARDSDSGSDDRSDDGSHDDGNGGDNDGKTAKQKATDAKSDNGTALSARYAGANGDSGNGGEQAGALNGPNGAHFNMVKEITLGQGSAFICHRQPVIVNTQHGKVRVAPGASAFIAQFGKSVSIYNLGDYHDNDIHFLLGDNKIAIPVGEQVLLTKEPETKFEKVNPVQGITARNANLDATIKDTNVFHAEYSAVSALDHIPQFGRLVNSKREDDRVLADKLIKMAAVLTQLRAPFDEPQTKPPAATEK
jgi:hypothetical protein